MTRRLSLKNPTNSANRYAPAPYSGDGLEIIANLSPNTNTPAVLAEVAEWHEGKHGARSRTIARALRVASGTVAPRAANDNGQYRRRAA